MTSTATRRYLKTIGEVDDSELSEVGWSRPRHLSSESWDRLGFKLRQSEQKLQWCWGDWWVRRDERDLPDGWDGPSRRTLDNYAIVARAYPNTRRRVNVSFKHHAELAHRPEAEQDELLDWCAGPQRPSVLDLREEKQRRAAAKLPPPTPPSSPSSPSSSDRVEPPKLRLVEPTELVTPPVVPRISVLKLELTLADDAYNWLIDTAAAARISPAGVIANLIEQARRLAS